jgi:single-strand DNA-binding protein
MNVFNCTARLGRDAEVRVTQGGLSICHFTGAVDAGYGDKKKTVWIRFSLFGKRAEGQLPSYLTKGTQVAISGELSTNEFTDKDGNQKFLLECNVNSLDLIGGRQEQQPVQQPVQRPQHQQQQFEPEEDFSDDIPF